MSTQTASCQHIVAQASPFVDGSLKADERRAIESHLRGCPSCREAVNQARAVHQLLGELQEEEPVAQGAFLEEVPEKKWNLALTAAPWWGVSVALHVLIIALAGLISMSIELPKPEDSVVVVTELQPRTELKDAEQEKPKSELKNALESKHETPPTDPTSKEASDIVVPPDILAKAELGDHFETINPDRPDTQSAFGNPDSHFFYSVKGCDEPEGGGGTGGVSLDDVIGVGGASSPGTGGGWGGGHGTGIGVGTGSGRGSFGQRNGGGRRLMVKRHGGSRATENAVDLALTWLAYHQEPDGHWDSCKYDGGKAHYWQIIKADTAVTGFALLAFLGAGHTEKVGRFRDNVVRAVAWLKSKQAANGAIFDTTDPAHLAPGYSMAIATLALAEAAGMANIKDTREVAQKAINYCTEIHQQGEASDKGAWRYNPKEAPDISVTGWFVMALKSAKVAGLAVNPASFEGAIKFVDSVELKNVPGADTAYGPASKYEYQPGHGSNRRRCAIGNLCRQFLGWKKEALQSSVELFVKEGGTPKWEDKGDKQHDNTIDLYYWYYGTLCVFQQGGDLWKRWNEDMKKALTENQCRNGDDAGSWPPLGTYSECWGRVGSTALGALCLEVYYRYLQLQPDK